VPFSLAPDHPELRVVRTPGKNKMRIKNPTDIISLRPNIDYVVFNQSIDVLERIVKERVYFVQGKDGFVEPPKPLSKVFFNESLSVFFNSIQKLAKPVSPLTKEQFLGAYDGRRRKRYEKAFKSLESRPLNVKDSRLNFFCKTEKVNTTVKRDPTPRGISPRPDRYHVSLGPYIKRIEHMLYDIINTIFGAVTVFKGLNASKRGECLLAHWKSFDDPVATGLDASRFDQHVSVDALQWEHQVYLLFINTPDFVRLLRWQWKNVGYGNSFDGWLKFIIKGMRCSGDMNTSSGNVLLMCAMVYCFMLYAGISKYRLANDGDDCQLITERRDVYKILTKLPDWFKDMGFTMKVEKPVDIFERMEFCQSQPIIVPDGCIMVRKYPDCIAKDCLSVKPLNSEKLFNRWIAAVGEGGLALAGGIPIMQEFFQCLVRNSKGAKALVGDPTQETGVKRWSAGMKREYSEVHPMTRVSFWRAFGVDPATQIAKEQVYRSKQLIYQTIFESNHAIDCRL
jgi:hypothetical protein